MIEIKGLYKSFDDKTVLSDINATFENGKTNLIIGQSGSGKTVLMKCIVGLLTPEKGEVLYDGRNLVMMGKKEKKMLRKEMGMIFQSAALFDSLMALPKTDIHSVVVLRHGKVIGEIYPAPFAPEYRHTMYSCSKTFVGAAVGLAIADNRLRLTDRVAAFFPEFLPDSVSG